MELPAKRDPDALLMLLSTLASPVSGVFCSSVSGTKLKKQKGSNRSNKKKSGKSNYVYEGRITNSDMIRCNWCMDWYHDLCVGITKSETPSVFSIFDLFLFLELLVSYCCRLLLLGVSSFHLRLNLLFHPHLVCRLLFQSKSHSTRRKHQGQGTIAGREQPTPKKDQYYRSTEPS
jgi:hypothetical protein